MVPRGWATRPPFSRRDPLGRRGRRNSRHFWGSRQGRGEYSKGDSSLPNRKSQRDGPRMLATEMVSRSACFSRRNPYCLSLYQVPQPLPPAEAGDCGPEDGGSRAAESGAPPSPVDDACPHYLEKVRAGGESSGSRSRWLFPLPLVNAGGEEAAGGENTHVIDYSCLLWAGKPAVVTCVPGTSHTS